jgi:hypothetical protein
MQVIKSIEVGVLTVIMSIGIIALIAEVTQFEEVAKIIVIPSLCLLLILTGYTILKGSYHAN